MIPIAPHITAFLQQRLPIERRASGNTCDSYAYAFKLLFVYASDRLKIPPSRLHLEHIDAPLVVNFLSHLEITRGNGTGSRNVRLAPSSRLCATWSIASHRPWSRFSAFWRSRQKNGYRAL